MPDQVRHDGCGGWRRWSGRASGHMGPPLLPLGRRWPAGPDEGFSAGVRGGNPSSPRCARHFSPRGEDESGRAFLTLVQTFLQTESRAPWTRRGWMPVTKSGMTECVGGVGGVAERRRGRGRPFSPWGEGGPQGRMRGSELARGDGTPHRLAVLGTRLGRADGLTRPSDPQGGRGSSKHPLRSERSAGDPADGVRRPAETCHRC
jgi:hypothetical protein